MQLTFECFCFCLGLEEILCTSISDRHNYEEGRAGRMLVSNDRKKDRVDETRTFILCTVTSAPTEMVSARPWDIGAPWNVEKINSVVAFDHWSFYMFATGFYELHWPHSNCGIRFGENSKCGALWRKGLLSEQTIAMETTAMMIPMRGSLRRCKTMVSVLLFKCQKCCNLRVFLGLKLGLKVLLGVKRLTFCNSDFCDDNSW